MSSEGPNAVGPGQSEDETFEAVFERYYRPISYYFSHRGFSVDESKDLTQETFLRAYNGWDQYRREQERGWLFTIAANIYRNVLRSRHTAKRWAIEEPISQLMECGIELPNSEADPASRLLRKEESDRVLAVLLELPPRMRQCFYLRFSHHLKYEEIAHAMQISIQSVKSQLHQAKLRIRRLIDAQT